MTKKRVFTIIIFLLITLLFIFLSLFNEWELSHETWGYWLFARVFAETGRFVVIQRSPLYILYLNLFRFLGYPNSVIVEYIITTFITVSSLAALFIPFFGIAISFFASIIWIPYMTVSEPPVQKLALSACCWVLILRRGKAGRLKITTSYLLLIFAYLFRPTFFVLIPIFIFYDLYVIKKQNKMNIKRFIPKLKTDWPLGIVLILISIFILLQSPHRWNNVFFGSSIWFPHNGKNEEIVQNYNRSYIQEKYGTFEGHDFYFTNNELFGGAHNTIEAIWNNPFFIFRQVINYLNQTIDMTIKFTMFSNLHAYNYFNLGALIFIAAGALLGAKKSKLTIFATGSFIIYFACIVFMPQYRYLIFPVFPLFIISAYGYANIFVFSRFRKFLFAPFCIILLLVFSPTFTGINYYNRTYLDWISQLQSVFMHYRSNDLRILENRSNQYVSSFKTSYNEISNLFNNCKGVMSLEYTYLGAFTKIPLNRIYDVWEIPPFGKLGDSVYNGLNPNRIDCLLISRELVLYPGEGTNSKIRYENYILPYAQQLKSLGATVKDIPTFGTAIILPRK